MPDLPEETLLVPARQPLLRDRSAVRDGVESLWANAPGLAARAGDLRLRPPTHHLRLRARAPDPRPRARLITKDAASAATITHLAIAFCRCMNIPARYCTGYLGDIGMPPPYGPMDFAAWFEAYLDGRWYTFDARNNMPRIGRILIARGRDAADVAISNTFGPNTLTSFRVWTDEGVPAADVGIDRLAFPP